MHRTLPGAAVAGYCRHAARVLVLPGRPAGKVQDERAGWRRGDV